MNTSRSCLGWSNCDDVDVNASLQSFFDGVEKHEKGARIWMSVLMTPSSKRRQATALLSGKGWVAEWTWS